jgi:hypothetical protein
MWQELVDSTVRVSRQSFEHVLEITVRIVAIEFSRLDQTHDDSGTLTRTQGAGEEPVRSPESNRSDSVFHVVVVCALTKVHESHG